MEFDIFQIDIFAFFVKKHRIFYVKNLSSISYANTSTFRQPSGLDFQKLSRKLIQK